MARMVTRGKPHRGLGIPPESGSRLRPSIEKAVGPPVGTNNLEIPNQRFITYRIQDPLLRLGTYARGTEQLEEHTVVWTRYSPDTGPRWICAAADLNGKVVGQALPIGTYPLAMPHREQGGLLRHQARAIVPPCTRYAPSRDSLPCWSLLKRGFRPSPRVRSSPAPFADYSWAFCLEYQQAWPP